LTGQPPAALLGQSWKTPREGLMNIAASFPSVMKPRLSIQ
jgi:hypothetical protein